MKLRPIIAALRAEWFPILAIVVLMTVARSSIADHYYVPSGSMEYSLLPGDRVVVDKTAYGLRIPLTKVDVLGSSRPERGDIAVFDSPRDGTRLIKRVAAVGGDVVALRDGHLTVNGEPLGAGPVERYGDTAVRLNLTSGGGPDLPVVRVPDGKVLMLGDHRGDSLDGRYFGLIDETELFGKAVRVYYRRGDGLVWQAL